MIFNFIGNLLGFRSDPNNVLTDLLDQLLKGTRTLGCFCAMFSCCLPFPARLRCPVNQVVDDQAKN